MKTKVLAHFGNDDKVNGYAFDVKGGIYHVKTFTGATYMNKTLDNVPNLDNKWEPLTEVEIPNLRDFEYSILMKHFWEMDKWINNFEMPHVG